MLIKRTELALTFTAVLLCSVLAIAPCVRFASAQTISITIEADGGISPSTAPIQRFGDLYVLTGYVGGISVEKSNITLDGNGHKVGGKIEGTTFGGEKFTVYDTGGIYLRNVENVIVKNFVLNRCEIGVSLNRVSNVTVTSNIVMGAKKPLPTESRAGVFVWQGNNNKIIGNQFEDNYEAIYLGYDSEHCTISGNNITGNSIGIGFWNASNNNIYHNSFINNTLHVYDYGANSLQTGPRWIPSLNTWDNGKEGNFWNDFNATDTNSDGIGDTPYKVDPNNQDGYPLMKPWDPLKPVDTTPLHVSISSPENKVYNVTNVTLTFSTNEPASKISYSLDGQANVTTTGNTTLIGLSNGSHNLIVYVTDQFGNTGISESVCFSVEVPFPTTLVIASTATVAIIGVGLLVYFRKRKH